MKAVRFTQQFTFGDKKLEWWAYQTVKEFPWSHRPTFSRFDTIHACDRRTDRRNCRGIYALYHIMLSRVKMANVDFCHITLFGSWLCMFLQNSIKVPRSNGGWVIEFCQKFKMAALRHLELLLGNDGPPTKSSRWPQSCGQREDFVGDNHVFKFRSIEFTISKICSTKYFTNLA